MVNRVIIPENYAVPEELLHLVDGFIKRREQEVQVMRDCIDHSDYAMVQMLAHRLVGNGDAYGFPQLTQLGRDLEFAAKAKDAEKSNGHIQILEIILRQ